MKGVNSAPPLFMKGVNSAPPLFMKGVNSAAQRTNFLTQLKYASRSAPGFF